MPQETNRNYHILLDYDGVLINFIGGVEKEFNVDLSDISHWGCWDTIGITKEEFWNKIRSNHKFWADLQPYPWARELLNMCLEKTRGNVTIATSPDTSITCASQKMFSIVNNFPYMARKVLIGPEKHLLANPNHVLIDDSQVNINKFSNNGGKVILFPQLWNHSNTKPDHNVVKEISDQLDELFQVAEISRELKIKN